MYLYLSSYASTSHALNTCIKNWSAHTQRVISICCTCLMVGSCCTTFSWLFTHFNLLYFYTPSFRYTVTSMFYYTSSLSATPHHPTPHIVTSSFHALATHTYIPLHTLH